MRKPEVIITMLILLLSSGCGMVAVMGTPTRHEKKIPAEYDLTEQKKKKIVIWVESPTWANIPANLSGQLRTSLHANLTEKLKVKSKYIIADEKVRSAAATNMVGIGMGVSEVGKAVGADLVLFAEMQEFSMPKVAEMDYYKGRLAGRVGLFDSATGQQLWPVTEQGKRIHVAFDIEKGNYSKATNRLARAFAHCTTRYLYNCPVDKFRIFEDKSNAAWENWQD